MARDTPKPRLCHLRKWPDYSGYGFNLHAEKGVVGHFIGKVDADSPALVGGLREGDRIIEVNGTNIGNENHQQVVARILSVPNETRILVADSQTCEFYRQKKTLIYGDMPEVEVMEAPLVNPFTQRTETLYKGKLCELKIWSNFIGYGFNLHAEKGNPSHIIGKVDPKSPAETAGMTDGDRIVEVNGAIVLDESHAEVVKKIKSDPKKVTLLVVSAACEKFLREKGTSLMNQMVGITRTTCPDTNPFTSTARPTESSPAAVGISRPQTSPHTTCEAAAVSSHVKPTNEGAPPRHRLCYLRRPEGSNVESFGFTMHATKGVSGNFIAEVDSRSVAEKAGLQKGDRLIEVNGVNVETMSHKQVVELIKSVPDETCLLVINDRKDHECKGKSYGDMPVSSPNCQGDASHLKGVESNEANSKVKNHEEEAEDDLTTDYRKITDEMIAVAEREAKTERNTSNVNNALNTICTPKSSSGQSSPGITYTSESPDVSRAEESKKQSVVVSGIEFAPSAEEARKRMAKKSRVKEDNLSIRDKFKLFERL